MDNAPVQFSTKRRQTLLLRGLRQRARSKGQRPRTDIRTVLSRREQRPLTRRRRFGTGPCHSAARRIAARRRDKRIRQSRRRITDKFLLTAVKNTTNRKQPKRSMYRDTLRYMPLFSKTKVNDTEPYKYCTSWNF